MELFLAFPFGWWGIDGRWRGGCTFFFAFMFASTFALSLFALTSTFVRGLPLPLPLAMSGSGGLKSLISRERKGSVAVPGVGGRRGVVPGAPQRRQVQLQLEVPKGHYVRE